MVPETTREIEVIFYREADGTVPARDWFSRLPEKIQDKFRARIERLSEVGLDMERPYSGYLRDGIRELRVRWQNVNYRMLYFVHQHTIAVLSHGLTKKKRVPPQEIDRAIQNRERYLQNPQQHSQEMD